jgi:hypothetical protein
MPLFGMSTVKNYGSVELKRPEERAALKRLSEIQNEILQKLKRTG